MKILVSACLLGIDCKYNGKNNKNDKIIELLKDHELIPVCPEIMGGLPTPRIPAEIHQNKVIAKDFARDAAQKDFTSFTSGKYVWNVDSGLTLDKFDSVAPVNLLIKGKKTDKIVVKNCDVDAKATAKANQ